MREIKKALDRLQIEIAELQKSSAFMAAHNFLKEKEWVDQKIKVAQAISDELVKVMNGEVSGTEASFSLEN